MAQDAPVDLYIAAYDDPAAAQEDWDTIKQLASEKVLKVDAVNQDQEAVRHGAGRR